MTQDSPTIIDRFMQMPRAIRWLAAATAATVVFIGWSEWLQPLTDDLGSKADRIEQRVSRVQEASGLSRQLEGMRDTIASVGPVEIPGAANEATNRLQTIVNDLLREHPRVSKDSFSSRPEGKLRRGALPEIARGRRIETIRGDLSFEASPEDAASIVAALEASPAVERVMNLQFNRIGAGNLRVRLTLEAWVLGSET